LRLPFRRRRSPWQGVDIMDLVPRQNREYENDTEGGRVTLLIPRYEQWPFNRLIQPRLGPAKRHIRVPLDERGSFLWPLLDGKRRIRDLIPDFEGRFPADREDVPQRLGAYLYQMYSNRMIDFVNLPR
jgi:hypothetical protein